MTPASPTRQRTMSNPFAYTNADFDRAPLMFYYEVTQACDHGAPLAEFGKKNPLRKEIAKMAKTLHDAIMSDAAAAG